MPALPPEQWPSAGMTQDLISAWTDLENRLSRLLRTPHISCIILMAPLRPPLGKHPENAARAPPVRCRGRARSRKRCATTPACRYF